MTDDMERPLPALAAQGVEGGGVTNGGRRFRRANTRDLVALHSDPDPDQGRVVARGLAD